MNKHFLLTATAIFLSGCVSKSVHYNEAWSKAKNLTNTAGMSFQIHDQQLPETAYNKEGQLMDYKLSGISHPAYGGASGIAGVSIAPYGAYESFYWGWGVPGASHRKHHRLFAWMPENQAMDEMHARQVLENLVVKMSTMVLQEMQYQLQPVKTPFIHMGLPFQQWYLERSDGQCSFEQMNCMLSVYIPEPIGPVITPPFSYYATAGQNAWLFHVADEQRYPRVALTQGDGLKSMEENVFYQKLSARMPGWAYLYLAPAEVGIGDKNKTIGYPYLLEKGKPLLFVRPVR
ncbi:hypothetical protein [Candidatus Sororendozoicomonas aggregata]|uniref:hypothetical protein n=1 Tax=Candidatus Sororendozoicomonas aggregata TaxID=3073239 RepID=UPI002ED45063